MRILNCHIENFGKLSDMDINFEPGLSVIAHENGWGKSTLMSFIRVMFYGFDGETKRSVNDRERVKYKPWQGGVYGGTLTFESDGRQYTIVRTFGNKAEDDTYELRNTVTNLPCDEYSSDIGTELFKIDRDSFSRTVFIGQDEIESSATDDINAKMGNLADNTNDINNYESADIKLKTLLNTMSITRSTGSLYKLARQIADMRTELRKLPFIEESANKTGAMLIESAALRKRLSAEQAELSEKIAGLSKAKDQAAKSAEYKRLCNAEEAAEKELNAATDAFEGGIPLHDSDLTRYNKTIERAGVLTDNWNQREKLAEELSGIEAKFEEQKVKQKAARSGRIMMIVSGIIFIEAAVFGILTAVDAKNLNSVIIILTIMAVLALASIAVLIAGLIKYSKNNGTYETVSETSIENTKKDMHDIDKAVEEFLRANGKLFDEERVLTDLRRVQSDTIDKLSSAKVNISNYDLARKKYEKASEEREIFEALNNTEELLNTDIEDNLPEMSAFTERFSSNAEELEKAADRENRYRLQLADLENQKLELEAMKENVEVRSASYDAGVKKYGYISMAKEFLTKAKENMTSKYIKPLRDSFAKYYAIAAGAGAEAFLIDANAMLTYNEYGKQRGINTLSRGYKDLASIALRLAFVDAMYRNEKPMIVMDDALVNLDPVNYKGAMKLLEEISKDYQVICFTKDIDIK